MTDRPDGMEAPLEARPLPHATEEDTRRHQNVRRAIRERRLWAAAFLSGSLVLLSLAAYLKPDPKGYGTHRQLGLGVCGSLVSTGLPCPTCGMTTAFAHTVRLQWLQAFLVQPSGFLLALATLATVPIALYTLGTGRIAPLPWPTLTPFRLAAILLVLFVGGWAFKLAYGLATGVLPLR
jgi:hypothetical protein